MPLDMSMKIAQLACSIRYDSKYNLAQLIQLILSSTAASQPAYSLEQWHLKSVDDKDHHHHQGSLGG